MLKKLIFFDIMFFDTLYNLNFVKQGRSDFGRLKKERLFHAEKQ